jgi:hypothetical protein
MVRFADQVIVHDIPNLDCYTDRELQDLFMTDLDYQRASDGIHEDMKRLLASKELQHAEIDTSDDFCTLGLHYLTPSGQWIRETLRRSAQHVVFQAQQQQRMLGWDDAVGQPTLTPLAAAYIPISMQAQIMAYERAVWNAMETDQFDPSKIVVPREKR